MAAKKGKASKSKGTKKKAKSQELVDARLMKALSHKERVQCLSILSEREASPNELSELLNTGLSKVSYHVKVLRDYELIEMVRTEPRRGAVEHFYRAKQRALLPDNVWKNLPKSLRQGITGEVLRDIYDDIETAVQKRTFDSRDDFVLSWIPGLLDLKAWVKLMAALVQFEELAMDTQAEASQRLAESGEEGIPTTFALFGFESARKPDDGAQKASARKRG
jgi:DNA-binding transcriptional ArsR family regulator